MAVWVYAGMGRLRLLSILLQRGYWVQQGAFIGKKRLAYFADKCRVPAAELSTFCSYMGLLDEEGGLCGARLI